LINYVGGESTAGTKLKSSTGWKSYRGIPAGTDEYGFSALPGGCGLYREGDFGGVGTIGGWLGARQSGVLIEWNRYMYYDSEDARWYDSSGKRGWLSVRCVQNDEKEERK
jgi:uncharacterized protein (TIGR02145 family)